MNQLEPCVACEGTGRNSKGGPCLPCAANHQRNRVLAAVASLYNGRCSPNEDEIMHAVRWALGPEVAYAAGFKIKGSEMAMFAGPRRSLEEIEQCSPPDSHNTTGTPAFIVRLTQTTYRGEPVFEPVCRWDWDTQTWKRRNTK